MASTTSTFESAINSDIAEFVEYYCTRKESPEYAVLIKGKWGSGKSWFVKNVLQALSRKGVSHFYISLNGLSTTAAVDQELFRLAHPVLGSKGMALAARIASGALKAGLKIDLDGDGKGDDSLSIQLPTIDLSTTLKNGSQLILVFDDLERCAIPMTELLGYINHFVEHSGHKVLLIANEEEMLGSLPGGEQSETRECIAYLRIKEKLIGKTFLVEPEADRAVRTFVSALADSPVRSLLQSRASLVSSVFASSKYENLRHVRQILLDLERLLLRLPDDILNCADLIDEFVAQYCALSFELRSGMKATELPKVFSGHLSLFDKSKESPYAKLSAKYPEVDLDTELLTSQLWHEVLDEGRIKTTGIVESLRRSRFLALSEQPAWVGLWHAYELEESELKSLLDSVVADFDAGNVDREEVVLHIAGILLFLSDAGVFPRPKTDVVDRACALIDELANKKALKESEHPFDSTGFGGLGYHERGTPEFLKIQKHLEAARQKAHAAALPQLAQDVLDVLRRDSSLFYRQMTVSNSADQRYYNQPILGHLVPATFVDAVCELKGEDQRRVMLTMRRRYEFNSMNSHLEEEAGWLSLTATELRARASQMDGSMAKRRLLDLAETLDASQAVLTAPRTESMDHTADDDESGNA